MNHLSQLNHNSSGAKSPRLAGLQRHKVVGRLLRLLPLGGERRFGILVLLVAILCFSLLTLLPSILAFQLDPVFTIAVWLVFGLLCGWFGSMLEYLLHPERLAYRRAMERCHQAVREISDQEILLDRITHVLYETLDSKTVSLWRYHPADNHFSLLRWQGAVLPGEQVQLPLDVAVDQLQATCPLSTLPKSALRQDLAAAEVQFVTPLSLGDELIGLIGLGQTRFGSRHTPETLRWLDVMASQLALIVKNAWLVSDLKEALTKLQLAYRRTIDAQDEERRSLATEIHDDILGRLTAMALTLRNSQKCLTTTPTQVQAWLANLEQETQEINRRLREITQGLHPSVLADLGLISALRAYLDSLARQPLPPSAPGAITITAQGFNGDRLSDPKLERDLYYVTRQALDNAIAHAQAEQVFVHLGWRDQAISVTVQDTGRGMKDAPEKLMGQKGHLGLLSISERVQAWRGHLTFNTERNRGTTVHIRIPLDQPSSDPTQLQVFNHYLRQEELVDRAN